jgi:glycosyltransferase involved in cell wall biosynthesis
VSVVVAVRDMDDDARTLVEVLEQQTLPRERFEVVLADDGSTTGGLGSLATSDGHVRAVRCPRVNAYTARNRGIAESRGSIIASCDVDCRPEPEWLQRGIAALHDVDIVGGSIRFTPPARPTIWGLLDMTTFLDQRRCVQAGYAVTANLFLRRELFDRVGGFDDSQPNQGDYDFVSRAVGMGARLAFSGEAVVWHPVRNTRGVFVRKVWAVNRRYAERASRAGRRPDGLKLRNWVPVVQTVRSRRRMQRPLGLDRERLAESGVTPTAVDRVRTVPLIYLFVPYLAGCAQVRGWWSGRRVRREESARVAAAPRAQVLLVCSPGGHAFQLYRLAAACDDFSRVWVTLDRSDTRWLLRDQRVIHAFGPTLRNVRNLIRNLVLAWRLVSEIRPAIILTTGAALAVPFAWVGRLRGVRVVYVESFTRIDKPSLSCRLVKPFVDRLYVQWPDLQKTLPSARYVGNVFSLR